MRPLAFVALLLTVPGSLHSQRTYPTDRLFTLTAGVGNDMGWLGAQGERYLLDERISVFAGFGYTPRFAPYDADGPTFAAGIRSFTSGIRHRLFLEGGVSQVMIESRSDSVDRRLYGPGLQGGYQFVSDGGFTVMLSVGAGYALAASRNVSPWASQIGVSLGKTWRRLRDDGARPRIN